MTAPDTALDFARGYLRVPLAVWAALYCRAPLTRRQLQLVSVVIRESWGWQTKGGRVYLWTRPLSSCQFAQFTGLSTDRIARDLKVLLARGILREREGRYQLVAEPRLWKTLSTPASEQRPPAPKRPAAGAETALPAPDLKISHKQQRNVRPLPEKRLSTRVDKWLAISHEGEGTAKATPAASAEERFLQVVSAFAGELSPAESERLRVWIRQDGVDRVWQTLAEAFRCGPRALRASLRHPQEKGKEIGR